MKRLRRRISLVVRPIFRGKLDEQKCAHAVKEFGSLSLREKIGKIRAVAITAMKRAGFRGSESHDGMVAWMGAKRKGNRTLLVSLNIPSSVSQKNLALTIGLRSFSWVLLLRRLLRAAEKQRIRRVAEHYIVFSLQKIPRRRADAAFPRLRFDSGHDVYVGANEVLPLELGQVVPSIVCVHLIDGIDSEQILSAKLLPILEKMRL